MTRNPHGSIAICARSKRLGLQFPRRWNDGKQKYHSLKLADTKDNRAYAADIVRQMEWDYSRGLFDRSLGKYFQRPEVETSEDLNISELWGKYCEYKTPDRKPATIHYLVNGIGPHIHSCPHQKIDLSLEIRAWLLGRTSPDMTRRVLQSLATVIKWGTKHQLISNRSNPFEGMAADIRVDSPPSVPNAFSKHEIISVLTAFETSPHYAFYTPLVRFWLLSGCRPSEGIGLEWVQIAKDCSEIKFDRSIIYIAGKPIYNQKSKTNRVRTFRCQPELQQLLIDRSSHRNDRSLVFPSPEGKPIDYSNFSVRAWDKVVDPILERPSTPYSCRDTFITDQIAKGMPIALIAKWVDNSTEMIEKYYLDPSATSDIRPQ